MWIELSSAQCMVDSRTPGCRRSSDMFGSKLDAFEAGVGKLSCDAVDLAGRAQQDAKCRPIRFLVP
jgi:hypothetical protein